MHKQILLIALSVAGLVTQAFAATAPYPATLPSQNKKPAVIADQLFGINSAGATGLAKAEASGEQLDESLNRAVALGPDLSWRLVPGQWPADFSVRFLDPDGDGENLNFEPLEELLKIAEENHVSVVPVFDPRDLAVLGTAPLGKAQPRARFNFLSSLGNYFKPQVQENWGATQQDLVTERIRRWHYRINIFATPEGPEPSAAQQLLLDATAIRSGGAPTRLFADIGDLSSDFGERESKTLLSFSRGPLRSTLFGLCVGLTMEKADYPHLTAAIERLKTSTYLLPLAISSIKPSKTFMQDLQDARHHSRGWSPDKTAAAYGAALAGWSSGVLLGGDVFFDDAAPRSLESTASTSPISIAGGRMIRHLKPFYRANVEEYEPKMWLITYRREYDPDSYLVFWDWAAEETSDPAAPVERETLIPIPQQTYLVTPLVDDAPLWTKQEVIESGKVGLKVKMGRTPLLIQVNDPGFARPVPLGLSRSLEEKIKQQETTGTLSNDAKQQ